MSDESQAIIPTFRRIDALLESYYERNHIKADDYRNKETGNGQFMEYCLAEELIDEEIPPSKELSVEDPESSAYAWMDHSSDIKFPIPDGIKIPDEKRDHFIFYIIQHCFKQNEVPSNKYITQHIVPKIDGATSTIQCDPEISYQPEDTVTSASSCPESAPPAAYSHIADVTPSVIDITECKDCGSDITEETEGIGYNDDTPNNNTHNNHVTKPKQITRISKKEFITTFPARAHLNIFTPKEATPKLRADVEEHFDNDFVLYYYMDMTTALQMNDHQVNIFNINIDDEMEELGIVNYDLHIKSTKKLIYGIFKPNDADKKTDKWKWKLSEFKTDDQIVQEYGIENSELPKSSRKTQKFIQALKSNIVIQESLIDDTKWFEIMQIKSLKRNVKMPKITVELSKDMFIKELKRSFSNVGQPLIPIVVNKNRTHWIEWIKIIYIQSQDIYIGISMKMVNNNALEVTSICLDRGDILNKHRLVGLDKSAYIKQLDGFKTSLTEIKFTDNEQNDLEKKIHTLKGQIKSQQDAIIRHKDVIKTVKRENAAMKTQIAYNNHSQHGYNHGQMYNNNDAQPAQQNGVSTGPEIRYNEQLYDTDSKEAAEEDELAQLIDGVIRDNKFSSNLPYKVNIFRTTPIGAKKNIYIEKQFTRFWKNRIHFPKFSDDANMYYWLDYTAAIQMSQGYSKQYTNIATAPGNFLAVINYEMRDTNNNILYGIILIDEAKAKSDEPKKYPYKLCALMTAKEIQSKYGIYPDDLPKRSRKHPDFLRQLVIARSIMKQDINQINWSNLKLFKSQSTTKNDSLKKSVSITQTVMKEYVKVALERMNTSSKKPIPIMVIDKHNNYYGIEWILIVNIIHRNVDVGISFKYDRNRNVFIAKAIYLDKSEIESKHKLIGLKYNYCQNIPDFSLKKFKFKSNKPGAGLTDEDDEAASDISIDLQNEVRRLQQMVDQEQRRSVQLNQQLMNERQHQQQQLLVLQQQNQQYLNNYNNMYGMNQQQQHPQPQAQQQQINMSNYQSSHINFNPYSQQRFG